MGGAVGTTIGAVVGVIIGAEPVIPPPDIKKLKIVPPPPIDAVGTWSPSHQSEALVEWKGTTPKPKPPPHDDSKTVTIVAID